MTSTAHREDQQLKSSTLFKRRVYCERAFYAFFFFTFAYWKRNAGRSESHPIGGGESQTVKRIGDATDVAIGHAGCTDIHIRLNHLVSLIFIRPGEVFGREGLPVSTCHCMAMYVNIVLDAI